jgi:hypothetical protein
MLFDDAAGGAGGSDAGAAGAAAGAAAPWYSTLDDSTKGYIQNNGLADKDPVAAFQAAAKSHQELFQHFGAPADRLVTLPADQNPDAWKPIWQRLGTPAEATGYDLSSIKVADQPLDPAFVTAVQAAAHANNIPAAAALGMTKALTEFAATQDAADAAEKTTALEAQKAALRTSWGQNYEANMFAAKQAFQRTGATAEQINALESVVGYDKVMEFFRDLSTKIREDGYVESGGRPASELPATKEAAMQAISTLQSDAAWMKRWQDGGRTEQAEIEKLMRQAYPQEYAAAAA